MLQFLLDICADILVQFRALRPARYNIVMLWVTKHGRRVKCLFGNFYFSTFISPFDQSVSVSQFVLQVSKPTLAITRLSYETCYIIVADTHVSFRYGSCTNTSSLYECVRSVYMYEICLCLSACVLLRVLLVHMDATHCT